MSDISLSDSLSDSDGSDTDVGHILGHPSMPARTLIIPVVENGLPMLTAGIKMGIATVNYEKWKGVCVRVNHSWRIFGDIPRKQMQSEVVHFARSFGRSKQMGYEWTDAAAARVAMTATALCGQRDAQLTVILRCFHKHIHSYLARTWKARIGFGLWLQDSRVHYDAKMGTRRQTKIKKLVSGPPSPHSLPRENNTLARSLLADVGSPNFRERVLITCLLALRVDKATLEHMKPPTVRVLSSLSDLDSTPFSSGHSNSRVDTLLVPPRAITQPDGSLVVSGCVYAKWGSTRHGSGLGELYLVEVEVNASGMHIRDDILASNKYGPKQNHFFDFHDV